MSGHQGADILLVGDRLMSTDRGCFKGGTSINVVSATMGLRGRDATPGIHGRHGGVR
jgi:hypothetical protein